MSAIALTAPAQMSALSWSDRVLVHDGLVGIAVLTPLGAVVCSAIIGDIGVLIGGLGAPVAVGCAVGGPAGGVVAGVVALVALAITVAMSGHKDALTERPTPSTTEIPEARVVGLPLY